MNFTVTAKAALTAMDKAQGVAIQAMMQECRMALLALATMAREKYPTAHRITVWYSDQGDFMDTRNVLDEAGVNLAEDDMYFDDEGCAAHLYLTVASVWEAFCEEQIDPKYGRTTGWLVDIDKVLTEINLDGETA